MITDDFIHELISCPKNALKATKKRMYLSNRSYRNDISLVSQDGRYDFTMFLRQSDEFVEDFSVGLIWTNTGEYIKENRDVILIRYQGPHDSGKEIGLDIHHDYHIHQITMKDIQEGRYKKPMHKNISNKFSNFSEAIFSFVKDCGIIDLDKSIDLEQFSIQMLGQTSLF